MKIVRALSKKINETDYYKYIINLPKHVVEESKLLDKKLKAKAEKGKIIIERE